MNTTPLAGSSETAEATPSATEQPTTAAPSTGASETATATTDPSTAEAPEAPSADAAEAPTVTAPSDPEYLTPENAAIIANDPPLDPHHDPAPVLHWWEEIGPTIVHAIETMLGFATKVV